MNWKVKGTAGGKPVAFEMIGGPNEEKDAREMLKGTHPSLTIVSIEQKDKPAETPPHIAATLPAETPAEDGRSDAPPTPPVVINPEPIEPKVGE